MKQETTKKIHTLHAEHRNRLLAMMLLFLSNLLDLMLLLGLLRETSLLVSVLDVGLTLAMVVVFALWVIPSCRFKTQPEDEMAREHLNRAMSLAAGTIVVLFAILLAGLGVSGFSMPITLNTNLIGTTGLLTLGLSLGVHSLYFLLLERGTDGDEEEE